MLKTEQSDRICVAHLHYRGVVNENWTSIKHRVYFASINQSKRPLPAIMIKYLRILARRLFAK
jgi:hypothetical protein